jgi:hypothetical protein
MFPGRRFSIPTSWGADFVPRNRYLPFGPFSANNFAIDIFGYPTDAARCGVATENRARRRILDHGQGSERLAAFSRPAPSVHQLASKKASSFNGG